MASNVLLVILDAVQANDCSLYGHSNKTTPVLDSLRETSTVYTQARAPSFWSLPSHASLFTGYHVAEHGVTSFEDRLAAGHSVFEQLNEEGYETGVFSQNPHITQPDFGLDAGFETVVEDPTGRRFTASGGGTPDAADLAAADGISKYVSYLRYALDHDHTVGSLWNGAVDFAETVLPDRYADYINPYPTATDYAESFLEWERERDGWAACLNFMDAHQPIRPDPEHNRWGGERLQQLHDDMDDIGWDFYTGRPWWQRRALEALYEGSIHQMDATLGHIVSELKRRGEFKDTLLVVTSDHGDGFGEQSRIRSDFRICDHNGGIHEVLLHVPLLVKYPGQTDGLTVSKLATLTRFPTAVQRALDGDWDGTEFVPDGAVIASSDHDALYDDDQQRMTHYDEPIDLSRFTGLARATYEQTDDRIRKYIEWESDTATVAVTDANNAMRVPTDENVSERIESAFRGIDLRDVRVDAAELSTSSVERLQDLGYLG